MSIQDKSETAENGVLFKPIAKIYTDFPSKFGIPRQSGLIKELTGKIVFEPEYRRAEAVKGLNQYSHLWLLWCFSQNLRDGWLPTVRPPRLGGNVRMGVFATRSPYRPNPIGLSAVKLEKIDLSEKEAPVLYVTGADMLNETPVFDIKPYIPLADSISGAKGGFSEEMKSKQLFLDESALPENIEKTKRDAIIKILRSDPRPSYHDDENKTYAFEFAHTHIEFSVTGDEIKIIKAEKI